MTWKASLLLFSLWYSVDALHLSLQPLLSSLLSLSAREVLGILGIVCSSFLPSLLSRSTLFSHSLPSTLFSPISSCLLDILCFSPLLPSSSFSSLFFHVFRPSLLLFSFPFSWNIFRLCSHCFCQWLSIDLWLLFYDADYTCTSHIV